MCVLLLVLLLLFVDVFVPKRLRAQLIVHGHHHQDLDYTSGQSERPTIGVGLCKLRELDLASVGAQ